MRAALLYMAMLLALASCSTPLVHGHGPASPPGFALRVLDDTYLDGGNARAISEGLRLDGDRVTVDLNVFSASGLKACYIELDYDAARWNPVSAHAGPMWGDAGELLELPVLHQLGTVSYGAVLAQYEDATGIDGDGVLATVVFERGEFAVEASSRQAAGPTGNVTDDWHMLLRAYTVPVWPSFSAAKGEVSWYYFEPGDFDQNGEVSISDLAVLGRLFRESYPGSTPSISELWLVDADHNYEIGFGDLAVLGANLGNNVTAVNVYATPELDADCPLYSNDESAPNALIGSVPLSQGIAEPGERRRFSFPASEYQYSWLWVENRGPTGALQRSNITYTSDFTVAYDLYDPLGYGLHWADAGELRWHHNLWGDYNCNLTTNTADMSPVGKFLNLSADVAPELHLWATDRYRNGTIGADDWFVATRALGASITGYAIFGTQDEQVANGDPHAEETLEPLGLVEEAYSGSFGDALLGRDADHRGHLHWQPFFDPSGWYFWVRPIVSSWSNTHGYPYPYGTRSGVVHVL